MRRVTDAASHSDNGRKFSAQALEGDMSPTESGITDGIEGTLEDTVGAGENELEP